jgi:hypothetical protein
MPSPPCWGRAPRLPAPSSVGWYLPLVPDLTDDELLDFDTQRMANFDASRSEVLLSEQHDLYRNHLIVARWICGWADRLEEDPESGPGDKLESFVLALREVATHLRQGDLVPGGILYEDEISR